MSHRRAAPSPAPGPASTSCIRFRVRSTAGSPHPDGPMNAATLRGGTDSAKVRNGVE